MSRLVPIAALIGLLAAGCTSKDSKPAGLGSLGGSTGGWAGSSAHDASAEDSNVGGSSEDGSMPDTSPPDAGDDGASGGAAGQAGSGGAGGAGGSGVLCYQDPAPASGDGYCVQVDGDGYKCNPITSAPCNVAAGETCEFDGSRFACVNMGGSGSAPCGVCGVTGSEYCIQGFTCRGLESKCTRYCCDDYQCAFGAQCVMQPPTSVGICQATAGNLLAGFVGAGGADGGATDAGHDAAPPPIECNVDAPLGTGACITVGSAGFGCNPITNEGCNAGAGEACDLTANGNFECVNGAHNLGACAPCSTGQCQAGMTCEITPSCTKFCCDDTDCGQGICARPVNATGPGVCVTPG